MASARSSYNLWSVMASVLEIIPEEVLDKPFTDADLPIMAKHLLEWQEKAAAFGLSEGEIEDIREDHKGSNRIQKLVLLRRWKERNGDRANLRYLFTMAERYHWDDFVDGVSGEWGYNAERVEDEEDEKDTENSGNY